MMNLKSVKGGCGLHYLVDTSDDLEAIGEGFEFSILRDEPICAKCSREFTDKGSGTSICEKCEDDYSYGE
jgi:hypothetical protein